MYMYIDYNGYYYPKVLYSLRELTFPDHLGNSLSSILLKGTSYDKSGLDPLYQDCKFFSSSDHYFNYTPEEVYQYLLTQTEVKYRGKTYQIKEIFTI